MSANGSRPPGSPKFGICIGVPSIGWQSTLFLKHLMGLVMPLNCIVTYKFIGTRRYGDEVRPVAEADNLILHEALREGFQYLFFLEEDVIVPAMALRQLMATLGRNPQASVATAIVTSKTIPPEPMIYRENGLGAYWGFAQGEVFPIGACHMGATLIRLDHLRDLQVPTVAVLDYPSPGGRSAVREFFRTSSHGDPDGKTRESQDIHFCTLLRQQGRTLLADANVLCGHYDVQSGILYGMPPTHRRETTAAAVNLGCGLDWDYIDGIKPLRVDINEANKPDFRADIRSLPPDWTGRFDIVYSSHTLEHFDRNTLPGVFAEMVRVCKPGGEVRLALPSLDWAIEQLQQGILDGHVIDVIWGGRSVPAVGPYPEMYHKMGITRNLMAGLAQSHGLSGRAERIGYNEQYRMFKPPIRPDVAAWLESDEDFHRRFVDASPTGESVSEELPVSASLSGTGGEANAHV